jgi:hypothetical protein
MKKFSIYKILNNSYLLTKKLIEKCQQLKKKSHKEKRTTKKKTKRK